MLKLVQHRLERTENTHTRVFPGISRRDDVVKLENESSRFVEQGNVASNILRVSPDDTVCSRLRS